MSVRTALVVILASLSLIPPGAARGQQAGSDASSLAKQAQNPIANLITLPFQANYNTGAGTDDRTVFNLNIQPVVPFAGEHWNVIVRTIIPLNSVPRGGTQSAFGFGDAVMTAFLSPARTSSVTWGVGPAASLPSSSNPELLGSGKWGLGPSAVVFAQAGKWTMGGVVNNIWSVAGDPDRADTNRFTLQYFLNLNLGDGWAVGTAPIVLADWKAESGEQWTVPWGAQISKLTRFGRKPVNVLLGYYWNSEQPTGAPDAQFRFQLNFLFPTAGA